MLDSIQIRNFRRNKKRNITLGPITVIRGGTGKGKSSIVGAFKWVILNVPGGDSFVNWDANPQRAGVRLDVDNRHKVIRRRDKSNNEYRLDGRTFNSFGTSPPDPVWKLMNMGWLNFRTQHAGHFWFCDTPGQVAKQLNEIINLSAIDNIQRNLTRYKNHVDGAADHWQRRYEEAKKDDGKLDYVDDMETDFKPISAMIDANAIQDLRCRRMGVLVGRVESYQKVIKRATERVLDTRRVYGVVSSVNTMTETVNDMAEMVETVERAERAAGAFVPDPQPITEAVERIEASQQLCQDLEELVVTIESQQLSIAELETRMEPKQKRYDEMMAGRCPLCGRK